MMRRQRVPAQLLTGKSETHCESKRVSLFSGHGIQICRMEGGWQDDALQKVPAQLLTKKSEMSCEREVCHTFWIDDDSQGAQLSRCEECCGHCMTPIEFAHQQAELHHQLWHIVTSALLLRWAVGFQLGGCVGQLGFKCEAA
jgi:hypothetical protein